MLGYLIRRLLGIAATMSMVATIVFVVMNILPGDPAQLLLGEEATREQVTQLRHQLGLDRPLLVRLLSWYTGLVRGDLGESLYYRTPVTSVMIRRLEPTLLLALTASVIAVVLGVALGAIAALRSGSATDLCAMALALVGVSIPHFWLGLNLMLVFSLRLRVLPTAGYVSAATSLVGAFRHLLLPAVTLGIGHAGIIARMTRVNMLEVLHEKYVDTARAKGLAERWVIYRHVLRNSMVTTVGVIGVSIAVMLSGSVVTESVFAISGVGKLVVDSILRRDFPVVQGVLLLISGIVAVMNLGIDMLYGVLDPRIRYD